MNRYFKTSPRYFKILHKRSINMPRTKRTTRSTNQKVRNSSNSVSKIEIDNYLKDFDANIKRQLEFEDRLCDNVLQEFDLLHKQCKLLISVRIGNTAIEDLGKASDSTHFITISDTGSCTANFLELSNAVKSVKAKKNRRSVSLADDEGYLTAEGSQNSGGSRRSRSKSKPAKVVRSTRSLSRNKTQQTKSILDNFKTPSNKLPNNDFGLITPKVKPNTPQVILRRPKEGEMALSMQGSPLLVNTVISRDANVNIPLEDGRTISIQPQHGLRLSQLPTMDASVRQQIEVLRDNLIKVCDLAYKKKPKS